MATIVKSIDSATELKDEFAAYERDYYPFALYEALIDFFSMNVIRKKARFNSMLSAYAVIYSKSTKTI